MAADAFLGDLRMHLREYEELLRLRPHGPALVVFYVRGIKHPSRTASATSSFPRRLAQRIAGTTTPGNVRQGATTESFSPTWICTPEPFTGERLARIRDVTLHVFRTSMSLPLPREAVFAFF